LVWDVGEQYEAAPMCWTHLSNATTLKVAVNQFSSSTHRTYPFIPKGPYDSMHRTRCLNFIPVSDFVHPYTKPKKDFRTKRIYRNPYASVLKLAVKLPESIALPCSLPPQDAHVVVLDSEEFVVPLTETTAYGFSKPAFYYRMESDKLVHLHYHARGEMATLNIRFRSHTISYTADNPFSYNLDWRGFCVARELPFGDSRYTFLNPWIYASTSPRVNVNEYQPSIALMKSLAEFGAFVFEQPITYLEAKHDGYSFWVIDSSINTAIPLIGHSLSYPIFSYNSEGTGVVPFWITPPAPLSSKWSQFCSTLDIHKWTP